MIISIILLLFATLWGHDPRVTGIMKEKRRKERMRGGKPESKREGEEEKQ